MIPIYFIITILASFIWLLYESDWMRTRLPVGKITAILIRDGTGIVIKDSKFIPADDVGVFIGEEDDSDWIIKDNVVQEEK